MASSAGFARRSVAALATENAIRHAVARSRVMLETLELRRLLSITPVEITATDIKSTSVNLKWAEPPAATMVELEWKGVGAPNFKKITIPAALSTDATKHPITGLIPEREYEFRLRTEKGGEIDYSEGTFETPPLDPPSSTVPAPIVDIDAVSLTGSLELDEEVYNTYLDPVFEVQYSSSYEGLDPSWGNGIYELGARIQVEGDPFDVLQIPNSPSWLYATEEDGHDIAGVWAAVGPGLDFKISLRLQRYDENGDLHISPWSNWASGTSPGTALPPVALTATPQTSTTSRLTWSGGDPAGMSGHNLTITGVVGDAVVSSYWVSGAAAYL